MSPNDKPTAPTERPETRHGLPIIHRTRIRSEWIDHNGHFNAGFYLVVFDDAVEGWQAHYGLTRDYMQAHGATSFSVESHLTYEQELLEDDEVIITGQLLDFTEKKIHTFLRMIHAEKDYLAATNELMSLHISRASRRPAPMALEVQQRLEMVRQESAHLPHPAQAGRVISVNAKRPPSYP